MCKNASAFAFKRKYVLLETQVRLTLNVSAFWIELKCTENSCQFED